MTFMQIPEPEPKNQMFVLNRAVLCCAVLERTNSYACM